MTDIGDTIRKLRRQKHMTQRELAKKSGITNSAIGSIEAGFSGGTLYTIESLLDALGYKLVIVKKSESINDCQWE